jgi:hypothetical protein
VGGRAIAAGLVLAAALLDVNGQHALAFYALLAAVPAMAAAALTSFGTLVEHRAAAGSDGVLHAQPALWGVGLALVVLSAAARGASPETVPPLGVSALAASLAVLCLKTVLTLGLQLRRPSETASPADGTI